ncbi:MAG: DUF427 domain-containing protein, partial [Gemmatimonadetes bacterium]|nr:DUF427 domain-containing protein [Gemmatimonadota bacterium]
RVLLVPERGGTLCEWKGLARSWRLVVPGSAPVAGAAWDYPEPLPGYEALAGRLSFH